MPTIKTTLLAGAKPEASTLEKVQEQFAARPGQHLEFMVFEVDYDRKKYYCCWSGGEVKDGEPYLTLIGQAAFESLANLPLGRDDTLIVQELRLGETPLRNKIKAALKRAPANSKICFIGDMQGELDGHLPQAFNLQKGSKSISH